MKILNLLKLPSPKDLGRTKSDFDGLPLRFLNPNSYCWEDYYEELKSLYPKRFFILKTLPEFVEYKILNRFIYPLTKLKNWIKYNLIYRNHIVNLSQPCHDATHIECYHYGWIDTDKKILYAVFNIFNDFIKNEYKHLYKPTDKDIEDDESLIKQRKLVLEIEDIHYWWNYQRIFDQKKLSELNPRDFESYGKLESMLSEKENEMLNRLIKIRESLWT